MFRFRVHQGAIAWMAALAVLLGALMPAAGQVATAGDGKAVHWLEVCTAFGLERLAPDDASHRDEAPAGMRAHCLYCFTHADGFALPPLDLPAFLPYDGTGARLPQGHQVPRPLFVRAAAQARAPPPAA